MFPATHQLLCTLVTASGASFHCLGVDQTLHVNRTSPLPPGRLPSLLSQDLKKRANTHHHIPRNTTTLVHVGHDVPCQLRHSKPSQKRDHFTSPGDINHFTFSKFKEKSKHPPSCSPQHSNSCARWSRCPAPASTAWGSADSPRGWGRSNRRGAGCAAQCPPTRCTTWRERA
jgi:hypothetical protein